MGLRKASPVDLTPHGITNHESIKSVYECENGIGIYHLATKPVPLIYHSVGKPIFAYILVESALFSLTSLLRVQYPL